VLSDAVGPTHGRFKATGHNKTQFTKLLVMSIKLELLRKKSDHLGRL
jgi:hypothetical protein